MEQKEEFGHLSMRQVQYLEKLKKLGGRGIRRGDVTAIAKSCSVSHVAVNRFFKECREKGYLTETYAFTEQGERFLKWHEKLVEDTKEYLRRNQIPETLLEESTRQLYEHVSYEVLAAITRSDRKIQKMIGAEGSQEVLRNFPKSLERGTYPVRIAIFQLQTGLRPMLSMAYRGFEPVAMLRSNNRGSYLELTIREITAHSRINGQDMTGHLSRLRYVENGNFFEAPVRKGKVILPLDAFRFRKNSRGKVDGSLYITVSCNVGEMHMPESTAQLLVFV